MRLICPNCGAQYEIGDDVIPDDGRDVQCSNCGHTWFESATTASAQMEGAPQSDAPYAPSPPDRSDRDGSDRDTDADLSGLGGAVPQPPAAVRPPVAPDQPSTRPTLAPTQVRATLDPSIADILREEAAREEAARRADTTPTLESQGDLGLEEPTRDTQRQTGDHADDAFDDDADDMAPPAVRDPGKDRLDRLQGRPVAVAVATRAAGTRSEVFPDIEEINSTLRSSSDRGPMAVLAEEEDAASARRSGRAGFFAMLGLFVVLTAIYAFADDISTALPVLDSTLTAYVAVVDQGRVWLDRQLQALMGAVGGSSGTD